MLDVFFFSMTCSAVHCQMPFENPYKQRLPLLLHPTFLSNIPVSRRCDVHYLAGTKPCWLDCSALNFTSFGVYGLCFTSKVHILEAYKYLPLFDPKSRNMTSLKRHFLKNFSTDLSEILMVDTKLMLEKVLKVSCRHLLPFLSYRENPAGGGGQNLILPPQRGAGS